MDGILSLPKSCRHHRYLQSHDSMISANETLMKTKKSADTASQVVKQRILHHETITNRGMIKTQNLYLG